MLPFRQRHPEHELQKIVAQYLNLVLPHNAWFTSIDHAGGGRLQQAIKQGRGVKAGLADIWIVFGGRLFCLELKRPGGGNVSNVQRTVAEELHRAGVSTLLATSLDQVADCLAIWKIPSRDANQGKIRVAI